MLVESNQTQKASNLLTRARWSPYLVGVLIGLLSWAVFAIVDKPLGITTTVAQASAAVAEPFVGEQGLKNNAYFATHMPAMDYGLMFVIGTFLGAGVGSIVSRSFKLETVPDVWREYHGNSAPKRLAVAFIGGAIAMYGARMAGGCTSGNGLSGSMQLAVSGWTFFFTMFASGLATAWLLFRKPRAAH